MSRLIIAIAFLFVLPATSMAGGKKKAPVSVSFHLQGDAGEGNKLVFPFTTAGQQLHFRKHPEFSSQDVVAFQSFPSDDPSSYGLILQLNKVGRQRLTSMSASNNGKFLLVMVNGTVRDAVLIDREVNDGLLVIWQRIGAAEVRAADLIMPRIGEDPKAWKQRLKEEKKK
jgi:hypothetical protein